MDAQKIKNKLNGAILKGKKFKVEEARPKKRSRNEDETEDSTKVSKEKTKKQKKDRNTVAGVELPADRHVKRGWTEPAAEKKRSKKSETKKSKSQKSKYTEKAECLFRTNAPPNQASHVPEKNKKEGKKAGTAIVVHEFATTNSYPTFLRAEQSGSRTTGEYVEGKGWVDQDGNLKEPAPETAKLRRERDIKQAGGTVPTGRGKRNAIAPVKQRSSSPEDETSSAGSSSESEDLTSSSGSSSEEESEEESDGESGEEKVSPDTPGKAITEAKASDTSSIESDADSDDSSSGSSDSDSDSEGAEASDEGSVASKSVSSEEPGPILTDISKVAADTAEKPDVHPLEALFKKPRANPSTPSKPALEVDTSFSFFQADQDVDPQTPFTGQDLQGRGVRSAAPTPDTAAPSRTTFRFGEESEDEDDAPAHSPSRSTPRPANSLATVIEASGVEPEALQPGEESEFASWFWENRGENNRAWKKRRREAAKDQRQKQNRQRAGRSG